MSVMFQGGPMDGQMMQGEQAGRPSLSGKPTGGPSDSLREAIDALTRYLEAEQEDEDIAAAMKHLSGLQDLLAKQQADQDGLMQGKATPRAMRRASGAQA